MVTQSTAARNAGLNAKTALLDAGAGAPSLVIGSAGMGTTLITFSLDGTDAFGAAANGTATATGLPISAAATAGSPTQAAAYEYRDGDGAVVFSGTSVTATGGGGEVQMSDVNIVSGNSYNLTAASFTEPAS